MKNISTYPFSLVLIFIWLLEPCYEAFISSKRLSKLNFQLFDNNLKKKILPIKPEFSRIINVNQIPQRKPIVCKLLARDIERKGLEKRFDIPQLLLFNANVTISRKDSVSILVEGVIEAHLKEGELLDTNIIKSKITYLKHREFVFILPTCLILLILL